MAATPTIISVPSMIRTAAYPSAMVSSTVLSIGNANTAIKTIPMLLVDVKRAPSATVKGHAMTASTGLRAENGNAAPRPNRITKSGLRPGMPIRLARSGRRLATSTG